MAMLKCFETMSTDDKENLLDYAINHIFLPPRLPNASDHSPNLEAGLIALVREFADQFDQDKDAQSTDWVTVTSMLASMSRVHDGRAMSEHTVAKEIEAMRCGDVLPIYIAGQNAAIILRRPLDKSKNILTVESFEVSPKDWDITHTEGKLCIVYPSVGRLSIPMDSRVIESLAQFIVYHERRSMLDDEADQSNARQNTGDTPSPRFITELLTGTIRGYSTQPAETQKETVFISKRIDNHVLCSQDSEAPWRRSPIWLVIRVALQTTMQERQIDGCIGYKAFVLHIFSCLLEVSSNHRPDHLLSVMNARLGRRIYKAAKTISTGCFAWDSAVRVNQETAAELEKRWVDIQRETTTREISWNAPTDQDLIRAAHIRLDKFAPYLKEVQARDQTFNQQAEQESTWKIPGGIKYAIRPVGLNYSKSALPPKLANISSVPLERTIHLYDFECWVAQRLPTVQGSRNMRALEVALTEYKSIAFQHYKGDPERILVAFLTVVEIWVAIDRMVTAWQPKLLEYSPEIPENVPECLLLPRRDQMERLSCVEKYLNDRHRESHGESSIFYDSTDSNSFVNWFVDQSTPMKRLLKDMENDADRQRWAKQEEIAVVNAKYQTLKSKIDRKTCDEHLGECLPSCEKCKLEQDLEALSITAFESPIPENEATLKCVVFELQAPEQFSIWRDATSTVLLICSGGVEPIAYGKPWRVSSYYGYNHHFVIPYPTQRITLAGWKKRYDSVYRPPLSCDDVIKPHSISKYQLVDGDAWATNPFRSNGVCPLQHIRTMCTMRVDPRGPYSSLQYAVSDTTHTSNQIIASQNKCSIDITLHDYEAFGHLRAGHKLQWRNILRELRRQVLSISNHDVHVLFLQAMWQAGPRAQDDTLYREAHRDLTERAFLEDVHSEISQMLKEIRNSWNRAYACGVLSAIAARIISVTEDAEIREQFIQFLRDARGVAHTWLKEVMDQCDKSPPPGLRKDEAAKEMAKWQKHILLVAMVCRSTFNVDDSFIDELLSSSEDVATFVECGNAIYISKPPSIGTLPFAMCTMFRRDQLLAIRVLPNLIDRVETCQGLDDGIHTIWKGHTKGNQWTVLPVPHERWCVARTKAGGGRKSVEVHFNLLDGALYVDDKTFGKLPDVYTEHPTYRRVFGDSYVLQATNSTMPGMHYATKSEISTWEVHFCLVGEDLVIRTRKENETFELIPHTKLEKALPRALIVGYTHWYDRKTGIIDLRPLSMPWQPNLRESWSTDVPFHDQVAFGCRQKGGSRRFIVDQNHPVARAIHKIFAPLESHVHNLLISFKASSSNWKPQQLEISLPRYKLNFVATKQGVLNCLSHRGFILDCDEDLGTLYGLKTKLVLFRVSGVEKERKVIIPKGPARVDSDGNKHPRISIDMAPDALFVEYYTYQVDDLLHRLIDTTLESRIHRLYLHALTSHPLADRLTGHTGTEEALQGLSRASTISFQSLSGTEISLLKEFGKLTPRRQLYSKETKSMQAVEWKPFLPPNVQHHDFERVVRKIWDYWVSIRVFLPEFREGGRNDSFMSEYQEGGHEELNKRASFRHRLLMPPEPYEAFPPPKDTNYSPRDSLTSSNSALREAMVFEMSRLVQDWPQGLSVSCHLRSTMQGWQVLLANREVTLDYTNAVLDTGLEATWRSLYNLCRHADQSADQSKLTFLLSSLVYRHPDQTQLYHSLLAFATNRAFSKPRHDLPESGDLDFSYGETPTRDKLVPLVSALIKPFPESGCTPELEREQYAQYISHRQEELDDCVADLMQPLPCGHIPGSTFDSFELISGDPFEIDKLLNNCHENSAFLRHIDRLQVELDRGIFSPTIETGFTWAQQPSSFSTLELPLISWSILLDRQFTPPKTTPPQTIPPPSAVEILLSKFNTATAPSATGLQDRYANALHQSITAYQQLPTVSWASGRVEYERRLLALESLMKEIKSSLGPVSEKDAVLLKSGLWPRITPRNLLAMLTITQSHSVKEQWKEVIVEYAKAITMVQRAKRISKLGQTEAERERELTNTGRIGWDPMENMDWLLVELESNLLVRPIQAKIAAEMLRPATGRNSVMQMNMGEGKSSVIVPIISASLADQSKLVRVVILKPLARQMFYILSRAFGELTNRRIYYLPLDRSLELTPELVQGIRALFEECARVGGILLCQPEHILSFKLMVLEALSNDSTTSLSEDLVSIQRWLEDHARDILDESDEILSPKYQLIYTVGIQHNPDGEFIRWKIVQEVLSLLKDQVQQHEYEGIDVQKSALPQQFPQIRVTRQKGGMCLLRSIAESIIKDDALPSLSFRHFSSSTRNSIMDYITQPTVLGTQHQQVESICHTNPTRDPAILKTILLLRGLLGHGVLLTVLKDKRWRVDYGLDTTRSMLAVPYRAKDSPSSRAEFGHTDVAIALTCLTYYYNGLEEAQLELSFEQLFKTDNPSLTYDEWTKVCPSPLPNLHDLNLDDPVQWRRVIFPALKYCKATIDFFLATIVFPKHMKEFPHKLSTSGWDLVQDLSSIGRLVTVTGFSGTNDNRFLLPTMVEQVDLPDHQLTNATVLSYLLQEENAQVVHSDDAQHDVEGLLEYLRDSKTRVLLDVGAQIVEYSNLEVATLWLKVDDSLEAAVFVDSNDELCVLRKDGSVEFLVASPYLEQLDHCVVYLDEAHTRGTDLKLPPGWKAAVTLGPRLCKDKLVQGCMRMRKLGSTHSVFFLASSEVRGYITDKTGIPESEITSEAVLTWSMIEATIQMQTYVPLWANQGFSFADRQSAWEAYKAGAVPPIELPEDFREKESHTLNELYGSERIDSMRPHKADNGKLKEKIQHQCKSFGIHPAQDAGIEEEQEREVAQEKEEEREVERPPPAMPLKHRLSDDIKRFIAKGVIPTQSEGIIPALRSLSQTTLKLFAEQSGADAFPHIWVTNDFASTIRTPTSNNAASVIRDDFLRPIQWVLSSTKEPRLVLLSPFEANSFVDDVRESLFVTLHVYSPQTSWHMRSFEDLRSFMIPHRKPVPDIPSHVINELNLFAGQLYFASKEAYRETCKMLGLYLGKPPAPVRLKDAIDATGFVRDTKARDILGLQCAQFSESPVAFFRTLTVLRRKGQGFLPTHLGKVLHSREVLDRDFKRP